ncbi:peptidoglycan-binding domain-containing protein [Streptomyces sp. NPDC026672]|uniref:peptidoglycan-binding domain-containing protein n=1 Tax=unclassified Streptomyces TaxID=2593676 RepID=UPI0033C5D4A7
MLLAVTGAAVATVAVAGVASGLFSYESPARDGAAPQELRESVPDATTTPPTAPATSATTPSASPTASATDPTADPTPSATPSATESSAPPSPTASATARPSGTTTSSTPAAPPPPAADPVLRRGDQGPEVMDLQRRLREAGAMFGRPSGTFDKRTEDAVRTYQWTRGVKGDEPGVYGPATRARLESETDRS